MTNADPEARPSRRIGYDLLRIISICGVIAIHTFGPIAANPDLRGQASWLAALVLSNGFIWAVPVFVMLAGALSLKERAHAEGPASFLLRRMKRILPALIAWTFIYLVIIRMVVLREPISVADAAIEIFDARVYPHLYFLWLIAGLYLVAPVLAAFLHAGGRRRAAVTGAIALGTTLLIFMVPAVLALKGISRPVQLGALTIWLAYVGYFVVGYALSLFRVSRAWLVVAGAGILVFGAITLAETAWPERLTVLRAVALPEYLGLIVAALSLCVFVVGVTLLDHVRVGERGMRLIVTLSEASFGVYLVHLVLMLVPYNLLAGYHARTSLLEGVFAYVFVIVVSFAISIGARRVPGLRAIF
jgi:surface polysaccharide O-acyltransferase-like enzyme